MTTDENPQDITSRADIIRLVDAFYDRIRRDEKLGPIFTTIAQVNWETHLPKMYDFWDTVLFRAGTFRGNPLAAHARLVSVADMGKASFDHWLELFTATVNDLFRGSNAEVMIRSASDMANVIYSKINQVPDPRFDPANLTPEQRVRYARYKQEVDTSEAT
jgi:hemoglobin